MDNDAVGRVLAAVRSKYTPDGLDCEKLRKDLVWAGTLYRTSVDLRAKAKRDRRVMMALGAATRFQNALERLEDRDLPIIDATVDVGPPLTEKLDGFIKQAEAALKPPGPEPEWQQDAAAQMVRELHLNERSPFEWLAGIHLAGLYERHFKRTAGYSIPASGGAPNGPYIRFVMCALTELGIGIYTSGAIASALKDARQKRSRRTWGKTG
jgi:hypothetical protein